MALAPVVSRSTTAKRTPAKGEAGGGRMRLQGCPGVSPEAGASVYGAAGPPTSAGAARWRGFGRTCRGAAPLRRPSGWGVRGWTLAAHREGGPGRDALLHRRLQGRGAHQPVEAHPVAVHRVVVEEGVADQ